MAASLRLPSPAAESISKIAATPPSARCLPLDARHFNPLELEQLYRTRSKPLWRMIADIRCVTDIMASRRVPVVVVADRRQQVE